MSKADADLLMPTTSGRCGPVVRRLPSRQHQLNLPEGSSKISLFRRRAAAVVSSPVLRRFLLFDPGKCLRSKRIVATT